MSKPKTQLLMNSLMPDQPYERNVLRKRAINLANKHVVENNEHSGMFLHIHMGNNEHYGIPYNNLDEILRPRAITPVPSSSIIIAGVIPYRGELIAVLDLAQMLKLAQSAEKVRAKNSWLVIVSYDQGHIALLVDEVLGNYHYQTEELSHSLNNNLDNQSGPILGIFNSKIAILNLSILLKTFYQMLE